MPTYEYRCDACGHEFELYQQITAPVKRKCPSCGKPKLQRLIGIGAGVIFKGGGFYETDYRSDNYKKSAEAEKKASEPVATDAKTQGKSESSSKSDQSSNEKVTDAAKDGARAKKPTASKSRRRAK